MKLALSVATAAGVLAMAAPAFAHHSFAMFDNAKEMTLVGTVKEFQWTNPHTWIQVMVKNAQGQMEEWSVEGSSPNGLARRGWSRTSLKPGDQVTMMIHPLKSGEKGGSFMSAKFPDGRALGGENGPQRPTVPAG